MLLHAVVRILLPMYINRARACQPPGKGGRTKVHFVIKCVLAKFKINIFCISNKNLPALLGPTHSSGLACSKDEIVVSFPNNNKFLSYHSKGYNASGEQGLFNLRLCYPFLYKLTGGVLFLVCKKFSSPHNK